MNKDTTPPPGTSTLLWVRAAIDKFLSEKPKVADLKSWVKVYEIKEKDEYDVENGWAVEYGIFTVEKYFFVKGMISQQQICQQTRQLQQSLLPSYLEKHPL